MKPLQCEILNFPQGSDEWAAVRREIFTASETSFFVAEGPKIQMNVKELTAELKRLGITIPAKSLKSDLVALLPDPDAYKTLSEGVIAARLSLIHDKIEQPTPAGILSAQEKQKKLERNQDIQRGKAMEPVLRAEYAKLMAKENLNVSEVGICVHEDATYDEIGLNSGFGASPDAMVDNGFEYTHGAEIKGVLPKTLLGWINAKQLPREHMVQVHHSMAVTGLRRWDFFAGAPDMETRFHIVVHWDSFTDRLLAGLKSLQFEFVNKRAEYANMPEVVSFVQEPEKEVTEDEAAAA